MRAYDEEIFRAGGAGGSRARDFRDAIRTTTPGSFGQPVERDSSTALPSWLPASTPAILYINSLVVRPSILVAVRRRRQGQYGRELSARHP